MCAPTYVVASLVFIQHTHKKQDKNWWSMYTFCGHVRRYSIIIKIDTPGGKTWETSVKKWLYIHKEN